MIYLVEDDESIRELVVYTLKSQGMDAKGFERPSLFWKELEKEVPALILLDIMLPEEDGISILRKLRTRPDTRKIPVIMLTAKGTEYDVVMGLDSGAGDPAVMFGCKSCTVLLGIHAHTAELTDLKWFSTLRKSFLSI